MWEKGCYNKNRMQCKSSRFAYFLRRNCVNSFQELVQSIDWGSLTDALLRVLGVFLCLTVHETCHGLAAYALGDPTAKREHRLSLNPLHHIDWFGLAAMLLVGFGWAKPVGVNPTYFKHPKRDMAITALAGPVSNLIVALISLIICNIFRYLLTGAVFFYFAIFFFYIASINVSLAVFNLIPIPPLDGSRLLSALLPDRQYYALMRYERYIFFALMALIWLGVLDKPLGYLSSGVMWLLNMLASLPFAAFI